MDPRGSARPAFAVVHDVAATWDDYELIRPVALGSAGRALIVHAAGPTDDGFRTIDVWTSEAAWQRHRAGLRHAFDHLSTAPVVRELRVGHLVVPLVPSTPATRAQEHPR